MNKPAHAALLAALTFALFPRFVHAQTAPLPFPHPQPTPATPTPTYHPQFGAAGAGLVYSHTNSAGPDESFFLAGEGLGSSVALWGPGPDHRGRRESVTVQASAPDHVLATIPQGIPDGLFIGAAGDPAHPGAVFRLNAPQPWWCTPDRPRAGETVELCGDELAERPDRARAWVYVARPGEPGAWVTPSFVSRYRVSWPAPSVPGHYEVWVYAGTGGDWGWGGPVSLDVRPGVPSLREFAPTGRTATAIQEALDRAGVAGGGMVQLAAGTYALERNLSVPTRVTLRGAGENATTLALSADAPNLHRLNASGWGQGVSSLQDAGDSLTYDITVPEPGSWSVWVRYAADNTFPMSGRTTLRADGNAPVTLQNLPNTGDWSTFHWARAATLTLAAGRHVLTWTNVGVGGINLDAFVFAREPAWQPGALADIRSSARLVVQQAEDVASSHTVQAQFPGGETGVVWLQGDGAALADLTVLGSPSVNTGVLMAGGGGQMINDVRVTGVRIADIEGTFNENSAVFLANTRGPVVQDCDLTGRAPILMEGMTQGRIVGNHLHAETRFGGNAEAAILARTHPLHQNIFVDNIVDSGDGGGPTTRRLIWFSTGLGSDTENYVGGNIGRGRFGDVAGTDNNVGETILFETNMRVAYYGPPESAGASDVTLPAVGPFSPPLQADGDEPPQDEYYLYVVQGRGLGQARRVVGRTGRTLRLDAPWDVPPDSHSLVLEALSHVRNIVVGNQIADGMAGLQLWIGGYQNIYTGNTVTNERRQGVYLFGAMSVPGPTMPNQWNAGIGPLFYDTVEGNQISGTDIGILLGLGDDPAATAGVNWPRALGTILRRNTVTDSRTAAVSISAGSTGTASAIEGTVVEFNDIRDAPIGFQVGPHTLATLVRRNHAYFWNWPQSAPPYAISTQGATEAVGSDNDIEGPGGWGDTRLKNDLAAGK